MRASRGAARGAGPAWRPITGSFALAALVLGVDLATKAWASSRLTLGEVRWIARPWFGLNLIHNSGAAFGFGARVPLLWLIVGALAVAALAIAIIRLPRGRIGLALMLGGAGGNVVSRLLWGHVVDFVQIWPWPAVFNLADLALRLGAVWLVVALLRTAHRGAPGGAKPNNAI